MCLVPAPESEDEYSDDDDMSWKVRRAAAKCIAALISSRPDLLPDFHRTLAPVLIRRFKEREENVKADVFTAYIVLLRQTRPPKGWLEAMEEPTQTGSNLHMLRGQVGVPSPPPLTPNLPTQPLTVSVPGLGNSPGENIQLWKGRGPRGGGREPARLLECGSDSQPAWVTSSKLLGLSVPVKWMREICLPSKGLCAVTKSLAQSEG